MIAKVRSTCGTSRNRAVCGQFFEQLVRFLKPATQRLPSLSMLWSMGLNSYASNSSLDALLDREGTTLEQLMEEDRLLSEVKFNKKLFNFLQQPEQVRKMIQYVILKPPIEADDRNKMYKYSFICCSIIACELQAILKEITDDDRILDLLFSFLDPDPENDRGNLAVGSFSKVVISLLNRNGLKNYLPNHPEILRKLVDLIEITSIREVLIRLFEADDLYYSWNPETTIEWLADTDLVELLIDKLSAKNSPETQANAAAVLCAVTRVQQPLLAKKISGFVGWLFNQVLDNVHSKAAVVHCLMVCISLLSPKRTPMPGGADDPPPPEWTEVHTPTPSAETLDNMLRRIGDILKLLNVSSDETPLPTTYGELRPPLGIHRIKVVEFVAVLLKADPEKVGPVLVEHNTLQQLVNLFFDYPFNNMLHHQVEAIISFILERNDALLITNLLKNCDLASRMLRADKNQYKLPDKYVLPSHRARTGNIGHLTLIANKLALAEDQNPQVQEYLQGNADWQDWKHTTLKERNDVENIYQWACGRPMPREERRMDSDEDVDLGFHGGDLLPLTSGLNQEEFRYSVYEDTEGEEDLVADEILKSLRISDEQECARHASWLAFQEDAENGPLTAADDQVMRFSSGSSSDDDDDEVVVGDDDDYEYCTAVLSFEEGDDDHDRQRALQRLTIVDVTSEFRDVDLSDPEGNDDDGESSQFDGGTESESAVQSENRNESEKTSESKSEVKEGAENVRDELKGVEAEDTTTKVKPKDHCLAADIADVNFWKTTMIAELEKL